jgi:hypothetical protein
MAYANLEDGAYTFSARATDGVELVGPVVSRSWTVDTQPPDTSISGGGPTGATSSNSPTFGFTSSEPNSTFACKLDEGGSEACNSGSKAYTSLTDGEHTFRVRATDATALTDPTEAVRTWTIDTVTPDTSISSGPSGDTTSTTATFSFSASEAGTTFECKLDAGAWESCTSDKTYSGLGTGPHTFLVRATDAAGNADQSEAVRSWTVTGGAPGGTQTGGNADTTKPVATITFAKQKLARVLRAGFVGSAASTEGGKLRLDVLMGSKKVLVATSRSRALGRPGSMKLTAIVHAEGEANARRNAPGQADAAAHGHGRGRQRDCEDPKRDAQVLTSRSSSSAAVSTNARTSFSSSENRPSTCLDTISGSVLSGRPTPTRTRVKSELPSPRFKDLRPLWPARPPPVRTSTLPNGRSISSCTTTTWSRSTPSSPRAGPTAVPDSFM